MKNLIRYSLSSNRDGTLKDILNDLTPFDLVISAVNFGPYTHDDWFLTQVKKQHNLDFALLIERIKKIKQYSSTPKSVWLSGIRTIEEIAEILSFFKESLTSLNLFKCPDLHDLSFLEELPHLQYLNIYWNRKATSLFNASVMPNLKKFYMMDCNHIVNFDGLKHSNIEYLALYGCNGASSFTSKLDVGDMDFLEFMPHLKTLSLDIMRTRTDDVYLKALAKAHNLEEFYIGERFFTFEQFAWLSAHLPNVQKDLEPCTYYISQKERGTTIVEEVEEYSIIGRRKTRAKKSLAIRYLNAYNALREQFKDEPEPPSADFKYLI